jgi:voltage-gated potassium channel Kch
MKKISLADRLRYAFDKTMTRGPIAVIAWLGMSVVILILLIASVVYLAGVAPEYGFSDLVWMSLMRTLDAGTMGGDQGPWAFLLAMLGVTAGGIFVMSTLIGLISAGIDEKLAELRKGRSQVLETGHTVILGWSEQMFTIISELVGANANQSRQCIAILADRDKVEMEDEIRAKVANLGRTRVVCRSGSAIEPSNLGIVSLDAARSIIILSHNGDDPDSTVIKTLLAIINNPQRRAEPYHIVAELHDPQNVEVVQVATRGEAEMVLSGDLIARIIAQTCHQSGLSAVYTDLLDFAGDEIYFQHEPGLAGKTFGEALPCYEDSALIGLCPRSGAPLLNPPMDTLIQEGDQVIAISEDDDTVRLSGPRELDIREDLIVTGQAHAPSPERTLILGWNWRAPTVINEMAHYAPRGSEVLVVANYAEAEHEIARLCPSHPHQTVHFQVGDTTDRRTLDALDIPGYQHVVLLCYSDLFDAQRADARTLVTLLQLRGIAENAGHTFSIVSEMLDVRNRNLAEVTRADDFVVSDKLISLMLAQVSENKALNAVFMDLFGAEGSEIYLKPASDYVRLGMPLNFYTVVESARRRGEVAFGYRIKARATDAHSNYGVVMNPPKSEMVTFSSGDTIIVLAEE